MTNIPFLNSTIGTIKNISHFQTFLYMYVPHTHKLGLPGYMLCLVPFHVYLSPSVYSCLYSSLSSPHHPVFCFNIFPCIFPTSFLVLNLFSLFFFFSFPSLHLHLFSFLYYSSLLFISLFLFISLTTVTTAGFVNREQ